MQETKNDDLIALEAVENTIWEANLHQPIDIGACKTFVFQTETNHGVWPLVCHAGSPVAWLLPR